MHTFSGQKNAADLKERFYYEPKPGNNNHNKNRNNHHNNHHDSGHASIANLNIPYKINNKAQELYHNIRQGGGWPDFHGDFYTEEFTYDPVGNVTQKTNGWGSIEYQYNSANQLIQAGNRGYEYDLNRNLIREELNGDYAEYSYNCFNMYIIKFTCT